MDTVKNEKKTKKKKASQKKYSVGMAIFGVIFLCAVAFIVISFQKRKNAEKVYEEMRAENQKVVVEETPVVEEEVPEEEELPQSDAPHLENTIDFSALAEQNPDIYAWIQIPGTLVDYPVLQSATDNLYYLNHTIDGTSGLPGSIYSESIHAKDFSDPLTVLYGHNMKNDTMFGSLHDYENPDKLTESPYVYMYLPEKTLVYQIFAAVRFSDDYLPEYGDFNEEVIFDSLISRLRSANGNINEEVAVPYGSEVLIMSTCIGNAPSNRFLVGAVQIDAYEK